MNRQILDRQGKKTEGTMTKKIILSDRTFQPSLLYALQTTKPLVGILRIVDLEKKMPTMGFVYVAMDAVKEEIPKKIWRTRSII